VADSTARILARVRGVPQTCSVWRRQEREVPRKGRSATWHAMRGQSEPDEVTEQTVPKQARAYRAVVIGCGSAGSAFSTRTRRPGTHSHAQAYAVHARTELVGVADTDPERLQAATTAWSVAGAADGVGLCVRIEPDIVSLCTPDSSHYSLARDLLAQAAPRLLLVEKPIATSVTQAEELVRLARDQGCALVVNYSRRFATAFRTVAAEIRAGVHGAPLLARFIYGKGLLHNGSHALDLARFWFGEPSGAGARSVVWGPSEDPTFDAELSYENGPRVRLEAFDERVATVFEMDLLTERSRIRFWLGGSRWEFSEVGVSPLYRGYRNYLPTARAETDPTFRDPLADCLPNAIDNAVRHLDYEEPLWCTGDDGLAALRLVEQIRGAPA
jgi:predicted dehydrogenase